MRALETRRLQRLTDRKEKGFSVVRVAKTIGSVLLGFGSTVSNPLPQPPSASANGPAGPGADAPAGAHPSPPRLQVMVGFVDLNKIDSTKALVLIAMLTVLTIILVDVFFMKGGRR